MIKTEICRLLNIKYPIFQGGMAWISESELASSVSNAGGLGIISAMNANGEYLRGEIKKAKTLTDKPFGVNIMLQSPFSDEVAKIICDEKVAIVTTGAGNPSKYIDMWKEAGIKVIPVVASVGIAARLEKLGVDAIIAEGCESGGHIGESATFPLIAQIKEAVKIPIIAAGGIANGRGIAAALMLGACGVQCGTLFLSAKECKVHQNYKNMIFKAKDTSTVVTGRRFGGNSCRSIKNEFTKNFLKKEFSENATAESVLDLGIGALRKAAILGDIENGCFLAGQISGLIHEEKYTKDIIDEIFVQAEQVLNGAKQWII